MSTLSLLALVVGAVTVDTASSTVVSSCSQSILLFTQSSAGSISNLVTVAPGASVNMGIGSGWIGAINTGTGCNSDGSSCTTGGPSTWNGETSSAEPSSILGRLLLMTSPSSMASMLGWRYPPPTRAAMPLLVQSPLAALPGPDGSCYSPCCSSVAGCNSGALASGGCVNSPFYYNTCYNPYAFPDDDGASGYTPKDFVVYICSNTDVTLTLCPGITSHNTS